MLITLVTFFSLLTAVLSADSSVIAISQPVTFRLEACSGGSGGYTCMTKPENCNSMESCELIAAWAPTSEGVEFTVIGKSSGYLFLGFGDTTKMDKGRSIICALDGQLISVYNAYNEGYESYALPAPLTTAGLSHVHGQYSNGRIACRFVRSIVASDSEKVARLDSAVYVFLGSGVMDGPMKHGMHFENPVTSAMQDVRQPSISGRVSAADEHMNTRPLWKAHGILMVLAWILCILSATLQPRYYRYMWPNNRPCGQQTWFLVHQPLMWIGAALFTIGFILALVATDGKYRQASDLPLKAHPSLGLIALILGWINVIIPFIRCDTAAHYRPIFNWVHFIIGTVAIVFAVTDTFIGLAYPVVRAPAWTAWVLVAAISFHLAVEILLELAGCFYYAKNKEKNEQYELRQQLAQTGQDPEPVLAKPKPAGQLFKNVVLGLHSFVMTVLVIVIIIGIAIY